MLVLGDFTGLLRSAAADIVVTYHALAPYPAGDPMELELATTGAVNGGILYMRRSLRQQEALAWLVSKTRTHWFVSPLHGMYADQHWLAFLLPFFGDVTRAPRERAINIAYWNLHERPLRKVGDAIVLAGRPDEAALLFHFSGFPLAGGYRLSIHSDRRFDAETNAAVDALVARYRVLLDAETERLEHQGLWAICTSELVPCTRGLTSFAGGTA